MLTVGQVLQVVRKRLQKAKGRQMGETPPYQPCQCKGACKEGCPCGDEGHFCEKFCACGPECASRFKGCQCKGGCRTKSCPCLASGQASCMPIVHCEQPPWAVSLLLQCADICTILSANRRLRKPLRIPRRFFASPVSAATKCGVKAREAAGLRAVPALHLVKSPCS